MTIERIPVFNIVEQTDSEIVVEVFGDKAQLEQKRIPRPAVVEVYDTITDNGWSIVEMDEDAAIEHGLL